MFSPTVLQSYNINDAFVSSDLGCAQHHVLPRRCSCAIGNYYYTFEGTPNLTSVDLRIANPDIVGTLFAHARCGRGA